MFEIVERTIVVSIDTSKCPDCVTKACEAACAKYARGIIKIDTNGCASTGDLSKQEVLRLGTECLACEFACKHDGNQAITINIPITGLDEYNRKRGQ
ncbi:MAG: hypothetical protein ACOX1U_09005 [Saccharofermentanales bacterium]|jgi:hypothetical protein|nr:hypothetical protein [Clostridiaceae bacterium]